VKHLSVEAVGRLIEAADGDRNTLLFTLLFQHGMRISECLALVKGSMQRGGYLRVRARKKGKHSDEKVNAQTLALWDKVVEHKLPGTLVFDGISRQWCSSLFHAACDKAGIGLQPRQGLHSLRHSLGHAMLDSGASLPEIQRALRHRSLSSTSVYLEADSNDVDHARAKAIAGAVAPPEPMSSAIVHVHGTVAAPAPSEPLSLAAIRMEIERLSALALAMRAAQAPGAGRIKF
jgi:integrase